MTIWLTLRRVSFMERAMAFVVSPGMEAPNTGRGGGDQLIFHKNDRLAERPQLVMSPGSVE